MPSSDNKTAAGRSETIKLCDPVEGVSRQIVMKPKGFLSKDFHMEIDADETVVAPSPVLERAPFSFANISGRKKLLITALIGVPILILSAT